MALHPWWTGFGEVTAAADTFVSAHALEFLETVARGEIPGISLMEARKDATFEAVAMKVDVERPQDLAYAIKATEPVAILFPLAAEQPRIFSLREDFPDTPHQNWTPVGAPCSLCIDDRPWVEARLSSTPADLVRRIQLWLAKAARGELHDQAQPLDPLFFRATKSLVMPISVFAADGDRPAELIGFVRDDNPDMILTEHATSVLAAASQDARFLVLPFEAAPQGMARLRHAPTSLAGLQAELTACGLDLIKDLNARLRGWTGLQDDNRRKLASRLVLLVIFPVKEGADRSVNDLRAFVTTDTAGTIGAKLGTLLKHQTIAGAVETFSISLAGPPSAKPEDIKIEPAEVHLALNRAFAAMIAGREQDRRMAILIGAGSLGSHIGVNLAREGTFSWTVIDQDVLLPHNLTRHALLAYETGAPKAFALARQMGALLGEEFRAAQYDVLGASPEIAEQNTSIFPQAEIIIDASASVAVSRFLSDMPEAAGRRICSFFNPAGDAVVLLVEDVDRNINLRDLEAQYHQMLQSDPRLATHLQVGQLGLRYSGSCRALTNRIPGTRAAVLSALVARGIGESLQDQRSTIRIWTINEDGEVWLARRSGSGTTRVQLGSWRVTYDDELLRTLRSYREEHLPAETGGVLLGIVDVSAKSIHVAHAMPQPLDSEGSISGFERGVVGLPGTVAAAIRTSLFQLRYIGEWHSHPRGSSVLPSPTDVTQLAWLRSELEAEGIPALMAIKGDGEAFSLFLAEQAPPFSSNSPEEGGVPG